MTGRNVPRGEKPFLSGGIEDKYWQRQKRLISQAVVCSLDDRLLLKIEVINKDGAGKTCSGMEAKNAK